MIPFQLHARQKQNSHNRGILMQELVREKLRSQTGVGEQVKICNIRKLRLGDEGKRCCLGQ